MSNSDSDIPSIEGRESLPESDFRELIESYRSVHPSSGERLEVLRLEGNDSGRLHPLLSAMIATVAADGKVLQVEVEKVASTYAKVFGTPMSAAQKAFIARKAEQVFHEGHDVYDELAAGREALEPEMIPIIFKACCRVAMCDGNVSDEELILLLRMTRALGMTLDDIKKHAASVIIK